MGNYLLTKTEMSKLADEIEASNGLILSVGTVQDQVYQLGIRKTYTIIQLLRNAAKDETDARA